MKLSWKELNTIKLRSDLVDVELLKVIAPVHMLPVDTTASNIRTGEKTESF